MGGPAPWHSSFVVDGNPGGAIRLRQIDRKCFALESTVVYAGERTGLEGVLPPEVITDLRTVDASTVPVTDLASVPTPLQWFVSPYGAHTPAALIHDRLIGLEPRVAGLTDRLADRYFRLMLDDLGVRPIRRYLMWVAVALRTRYHAGWVRRLGVMAWVVASLAGMSLWLWAALSGSWGWLLVATVAPFGGALLWGSQYGAGLAGALAAPWLLPPTLFGAVGYWGYAALEASVGLVIDRRRPTESAPEPISYEAF